MPVDAPFGRLTEVGELVQLAAARLPSHTVTTRFTVKVDTLRLVSVKVVLLDAFVFTLAVPLPSWLRLTEGMTPAPGGRARMVRGTRSASTTSVGARRYARIQRNRRRSWEKRGMGGAGEGEHRVADTGVATIDRPIP